RKSVPGLVVTKVKCSVPVGSGPISGPCTANFTVVRYGIKGVYEARATLDNKGRLSWSTTSRKCTDLRGRRASCNGRTSTGNGLISAELAEHQLLAHGIDYKQATVKAKSAVCTGLKSHKWVRGQFDDVFTQLKCDVKAADGVAYSVVFVMAGTD